MDFESLYKEVNEYLTKFSLQVDLSTFSFHDNWEEFCLNTGKNSINESFYLPRSLESHLDNNSKFKTLNFFHEVFGHGLFAENHSKGKHLHSLESILHEEEKQHFQSKEFSLNDLQTFRETNQTHNKLIESYNENVGLYEGFAIWTEWYLAKKFLSEDAFWEKQQEYLKTFGNDYKPYMDFAQQFINYSNDFTSHALMFETGFPKHYDNKVLTEILQKLYKDKFDELFLVILYGSRKPNKDIDLFIIENDTYNFFNGWLDIYSVGNAEELVKNLDISVTDPLFSGSLIHGDDSYFNELRELALTTKVTPKIIDYNFSRSDEQHNYYLNSKEERNRRLSLSYTFSYYYNALALLDNKKPLTLSNLKSIYGNQKIYNKQSA